MVSQTVTIINPTGLHMRPAGLFASTMGKYSSNITLKGNGKEINGKSPMAIMAGGLSCGTEIEIVADGADEAEALAAAVELVESGLGE
jgi:phosphocarrier protein